LLDEHIEWDEDDVVLDPTPRAPDIHVEIDSPEQSARKCREKLEFSLANGCPLGWLIDPERMIVDIFRPGQAPERLSDDGALEGGPVLPGYRLAVKTLFGWLKRRRKPKSLPPSAPPETGESS
jgi:Uma2 family endonuclease